MLGRNHGAYLAKSRQGREREEPIGSPGLTREGQPRLPHHRPCGYATGGSEQSSPTALAVRSDTSRWPVVREVLTVITPSLRLGGRLDGFGPSAQQSSSSPQSQIGHYHCPNTSPNLRARAPNMRFLSIPVHRPAGFPLPSFPRLVTLSELASGGSSTMFPRRVLL